MKAMFPALIFCLLLAVAAALPAFAQKAVKFVEFETVNCEEYLSLMDNALVHGRNDPSSRIYVLIYEGKERFYNERKNEYEMKPPAVGSAAAKIRSIKAYVSKRNFPVERFSFVKAGFRENSTVEMWTVPNGAEPPKPAPTLTKIRYRKGKARGFCTECCGV